MGVKRNFGYNLTLTFCNYLIPLVVYPYISRVLGVENIGICNFIDSLINYFVLFSLGGISSYGVREIARFRDNRTDLDRQFSSLVWLNILLTIVALIALVCCVMFVPSLAAYREFLWVGAVKLIFNIFLIEWFYQGMEKFKYITLCTVAIRIVYMASIFIFVHDRNDVLVYYALTAGITVVNSLVNWSFRRRFVSFVVKGAGIRSVFLPVATFGYYKILTSLYVTFNTVFLGFMCSVVQVGYFATATKLNGIIMNVFTALTTVMIPRVSLLLRQGRRDQLEELGVKTISILAIFSLPLMLYCLVFAREIVWIIAGPGYDGAVLPFRIVISLVLVIGAEQVFVQQFLMASTKSNKPIMLLSSVGAVIGLSLNAILTPELEAVGTSISWVCSEVSILVLSVILVQKYMALNFHLRRILPRCLLTAIYLLVLLPAQLFLDNNWLKILIGGLAMCVVFFILNFVIFSPANFPVPLPAFIAKFIPHTQRHS